jgi:hypothetical protein
MNASDVRKTDTRPGLAPWDMDFKGHWEMDRDLISEFIEQQQGDEFFKSDSNKVKTSLNEEQALNDEDEAGLMKCLPMKLIDDTSSDDISCFKRISGSYQNSKEAQSISSLKSKFDADVKALWNDVVEPLNKPLSCKSFDDDASLASSFTSEKNSLSLFNFNGYQPQSEVVAPSNLSMYNNITDYMRLSDFDGNNNAINKGDVPKSSLLSEVSPVNTEKFIKSGTNLAISIWSDGEFTGDAESVLNKNVSNFVIF